MEDTLIELLEAFGYPVIRQGSMGEDESYPETFITFWNRSEREIQPYDNQTYRAESTYDIAVYSSTPSTAYSLCISIRTSLKTNGWIITDRGHDVASDEVTHIGRGLSVAYVECLTLE